MGLPGLGLRGLGLRAQALHVLNHLARELAGRGGAGGDGDALLATQHLGLQVGQRLQVLFPALALARAQDGGVVVARVKEGKGNFGYDALKDEYTDLVKAGIIDPTKVTRSALQNAASVATLLLTSDALIADMPKDEKPPAGGGGHGGYDDMY